MLTEKCLKILLIEDDPGDVELIREISRDWDTPVKLIVAEDGLQAMEYLSQSGSQPPAPKPDLIILDLNLPKKNGLDVLREIKNRPELRSIPVVVLTTSDRALDIADCYRAGANCYLTKPLEFHQFERMVNAIEDFWLNTAKLPAL